MHVYRIPEGMTAATKAGRRECAKKRQGCQKLATLPKSGHLGFPRLPKVGNVARACVRQKWHCGIVAKMAAITVLQISSYATDATMHEGAKWPSQLHCRLARSQRRVIEPRQMFAMAVAARNSRSQRHCASPWSIHGGGLWRHARGPSRASAILDP